jgi:hypothetical protein
MLSYLNDPAIKAKYLRRARAHYKADEIVQGRYWQNGKGCNIGCVTHCNDGAHAAWAKEIGPEWLARLGDTLFEGLPLDRAKEFVVEFHRAIPVGVDLEPVRWKFALVLLRENRERVLSLKEINDELRKQVVAAIDGVIRVNESAIVTGKWDESSRSAARSAARSAWSAAGTLAGVVVTLAGVDSAASAALSAAICAVMASRFTLAGVLLVVDMVISFSVRAFVIAFMVGVCVAGVCFAVVVGASTCAHKMTFWRPLLPLAPLLSTY